MVFPLCRHFLTPLKTIRNAVWEFMPFYGKLKKHNAELLTGYTWATGIKDCNKMNYKNRYQPLECYYNHQWQPHLHRVCLMFPLYLNKLLQVIV